MDVKELVEELAGKGIQLFCEGENKLRYKAPVGAVTPQIKELLRENKVELISFLNNYTADVFVPNMQDRYEKFPLTDIQNSYVMGRNNIYELGGVACHGYLEVVFEEVIDSNRMEIAWNKVMQKHDMLRAIVFDVGYQIVQEAVPYIHLKVVDLCGTYDEKEERIKNLRKELANKQYPLGKWPMCDLVVSIDENRSVVHFSVDMLIADFLSMNIILNDLEMFYRNPSMEIKVPTLYRDIINYQQKMKLSSNLNRQKAETYWNEKIGQMGEAPELPIITKHNLTSSDFYQKKIFLDEMRWKEFCNVAQEYNITPSVLVISALVEVIGLWSSVKKFSINATLFNRPQVVADINEVVGDFTDVNVLSVSLDYNLSYIERIRKMQSDMWADMEHRDLSGVEVLRKLTKERRKNIIMPVVFTSTLGLAKENDTTVKRNVQYKISQTPQVYIDCQVTDENHGAKINWDVREGVFDANIITDMFDTFSNLILNINESNAAIFNKKHPLELPKKMVEIREKTNSCKSNFKMQMLEEGFINALRKYPNKTALITHNGEYTYEKLSEYVKAVMLVLDKQGIKPKDKVGINLDKGEWQIASVIAILLLKAIYVPMDIKQPNIRKRKIITSANIKVLLSEYDEVEFSDCCECVNVNTLTRSNVPLENIEIESDYDRAAYIIFTSGTTGEPKGVIITHRAAMNTILDVNDRYNIKEEDVFLGLANLSFDLSVYDVFGCFLAGGTIVLPDSDRVKDPKYLYDLILLKRISVLNGVPAQIQMLANYIETVEGIRRSEYIRLIIMSGDWIPVNLPKRLYMLFPRVLVVSKGGATEAAIWSISYVIKPEETFSKSIPYGMPLTNQQFYVLDESMQHCPDYVSGSLYIGGVGLSIGYLNDEELNKKKYKILPDTGERIYRTGDRGYYRSDGNIIFQGREVGDEQVKIHGHRIELAEIRTALLENPAIDTAVVLTTGMAPDIKICAVVSPKKKGKNQEAISDNDEHLMLNDLGNVFEESIDGDLLEVWNRKSELVVIGDIYNVFKEHGIFVKLGEKISFDAIIDVIGVPQKLQKLIKRWLNVLESEQIIKSEGNYYLIENGCNLDSEDLWEEFYKTEDKFNYSREFVDYLKKSSEVLPQMIKGNENPLNVLFPKGDVKPAMAAYHDNKINKINNGLAVEEISYLCRKSFEKNPKKTFRILEVGAGVGGTTLDLIPKLDGYNVEYHFTDLSTFFLNKAQANFAAYNWVKYGIFDINVDFAQQGYEAFSFDVILCANVLHNSKNIHAVMDNLKKLLVNNGSIIVLEETKMSYMLLTSMEFKDGLTGFQDERANDDQTFFTRSQWEKIISEHGGKIVYEFPSKDSKLELSGQTVYITRFASDYLELKQKEIKDALSKTISSYMIPSSIVVLPEIPLTENRKVDLGKIRNMLESSDGTQLDTVKKEYPQTELEKKIANIWCRELKIETIGRNDNFYDVGGDSLLIAQIVGKMVEEIDEAKDWEWSSLLTEMMQSPTVAEIAIKIEKFCNQKESFIDPSLIQIKNSVIENKNSVAKVLFHAGTGTLSAYTELLSFIEKDSKENEAVLGFSFGNEAEYVSIETPNTFKVLGKKYGRILQSLGYSNYILIGHCVGGLIALEASEYLQECNLKVSDVTLISATIQKKKKNTSFETLSDEIYIKALNTSLENELLLERTFSKLINVNEKKAGYKVSEDVLEECIEYLVNEENGEVTAEKLCSLQGKYKEVAEEFKYLASRPLSERLNKLYAAIDRADSELMEHERKMLNTLFNIFSQNFGCVASHEPKPYYGNIRIFSCEEQGASFYREFFGEDFETWKSYIKGKYKYDIIAGQHFDCIIGTNLQKNLSKILDFMYE